ncbi:MAG: FecR domain-containing protein [Gemmatimonadaceae bacterium]|nr:FecR domain-containing protein [Gemmatimonadaceae bacterium]
MNDEPRQPDVNGQEPEWEAFARFVAGESDPVEAAAVEAWLASHPADAQFAAGVKAHADEATAHAAVPVDLEAAWRRVQAEIAGPSGAEVTPKAVPRLEVARGGLSVADGGRAERRASPWAGRALLAIAATVVAIVGLKSWSTSRTPTTAAQVLATKVGQRDSIVLSDGTRVVLAPGSRLTVAAGYDAGDRSVTLDGAAYFDVIHDDAHPFTVKAGAAEIRDVGTAFTVKTDDGGRVAVAVTHGIVTMRGVTSSAPAAVELQAGDRAVLTDGAVAVARGTVTDDETTWTRGQLSYRDASLSEVQADLRRWYGIELQVPDEKLAALTVTMPAQPDSATVMKTLVALLGAEREQHGDTIILRSAGRGTIH